MLFRMSKIDKLMSCEFIPINDERGTFRRTYDGEILRRYDWQKIWAQESESNSLKKGTIRGFHLQLPPFSEAKCFRVIRGSAYAAFIDLRKDSPTFGQYVDYTLTENKPMCVYVPRGLACGICTLEDNTIISYKMDNIYNPNYAIGIKWNDPELNIPWPKFEEYVVSEKDNNNNMTFAEFKERFNTLDI